MNKHRLILVSALLAVAGIGTSAHAGSVDCKLKFTISGWSAFYKRSDGTGTITCTNGQSLRVKLRARGGGPSVGHSTIKDGTGEFSGVDDIKQLLGTYAIARAGGYRRGMGSRRRVREVPDPQELARGPGTRGGGLRDWPRQAVNSAPNRKIWAE
jgi:hypothetical protein